MQYPCKKSQSMANNPYLYPMKYLLFYKSVCYLSPPASTRNCRLRVALLWRKATRYPNSAFPIRMERYRKKTLENKFALIIFFSTTCSDCQKAFPDISTLYHTYKDDPSVCVLLIARGETEEQVAAYFREHQYNMKFFADPDLNVYSLFADNTIPRVFLADKDSTIILTQTEKVDAGLLISGGVEPHPYKPEKS